MTPENDIKNACLEYLKLTGVLAWRNNTGAFAGEHKGRKRFVRYGHPGSGDIFGVLKGGRFLSVECKVKGNKLTPLQSAWKRDVDNHGGLSIVAYTLDDLIEGIRNA